MPVTVVLQVVVCSTASTSPEVARRVIVVSALFEQYSAKSSVDLMYTAGGLRVRAALPWSETLAFRSTEAPAEDEAFPAELGLRSRLCVSGFTGSGVQAPPPSGEGGEALSCW